MSFTSGVFLVFLAIVFVLYWQLDGRLKLQNLFVLLASYLFYGWWDYRFLALIIGSSLVDYLVGLGLERREDRLQRRLLLGLSLGVNLGLLGLFKYYDFFVSSLITALAELGIGFHPQTLHLVLPVGISFYTFQTLSYTIDIYRGSLQPTRDPIAFFAFVSFFPQLVAGPIERARDLLPQFHRPRSFDAEQAKDGLRQALWGYFKKIVIADNLALHVDRVYPGYADSDGLTLGFATFLFALQIYCDFSGYSDIAVGTARLLGFNLRRNFAYPYFSRNIAEFWRRWHISLSSWFRDYVYIPLGGGRLSRVRHAVNIVITFGLSGLWHGANWTFISWGLLNASYYLPRLGRSDHKERADRRDNTANWTLLPTLAEAKGMCATFMLTLLGWTFFRADSLSHAFGIFARSFTVPLAAIDHSWFLRPGLLAMLLLIVEWISRQKSHPLEDLTLSRPLRWVIYYAVISMIVLMGNTRIEDAPFIYFQF